MDRKPRILIVEDRSIVACKPKRELELAGMMAVGAAATGAAAIAMVAAAPLLPAHRFVGEADLRKGTNALPGRATILRRIFKRVEDGRAMCHVW